MTLQACLGIRTTLTLLIALAGLAVLSGCAGVPPVGASSNPLAQGLLPPDAVRWPEKYQPRDATFFVHNEIEIAAPPELVWDELIHAETWPAWYEGAANVKVRGSGDGTLRAGSVFDWRTMDLDLTSTVHELEPPYRLSWESRISTIQGYHAWLIVPVPGGSRLITDESQHGFLATMQGIFLPDKLRRLHDVWLSQIKKRAEARAGAPAPEASAKVP